MNIQLFPYLQLPGKEALKFLLQGEGEGEPAHVGGLPALPEVHHALEVFLSLPVLLFLPPRTSTTSSSASGTALLLLLLIIVLVLHRHPVPAGKRRLMRRTIRQTLVLWCSTARARHSHSQGGGFNSRWAYACPHQERTLARHCILWENRWRVGSSEEAEIAHAIASCLNRKLITQLTRVPCHLSGDIEMSVILYDI